MSDQALTVIETNAVSRTETFMPVMNMQQALARRDAVVAFAKKVMVKDQDFGVIPGSKKPTLLKAGAEKLANFFGLEPEFEKADEVSDLTGKDHNGESFYYAQYRCSIWRDGKRLGMGEGSCNTWETKYRYRWVTEEQIPHGMNKDSLPSQDGTKQHTEFDFAVEKAETSGKYGKPAEYWEQFREAITAGVAKAGEKEFKGKDKKGKTWTVTIGARLYRVPNPEMADLVNTVQKMAQKRAFIAAMLIATGASQFFTQDLGDNKPDDDELTPVDVAVRQFQSAEKGKKLEAFKMLEERLEELTGAGTHFLQILKEEGEVKSIAEIKTQKQANAVFRKLWSEVERMSNPDLADEDAAF